MKDTQAVKPGFSLLELCLSVLIALSMLEFLQSLWFFVHKNQLQMQLKTQSYLEAGSLIGLLKPRVDRWDASRSNIPFDDQISFFKQRGLLAHLKPQVGSPYSWGVAGDLAFYPNSLGLSLFYPLECQTVNIVFHHLGQIHMLWAGQALELRDLLLLVNQHHQILLQPLSIEPSHLGRAEQTVVLPWLQKNKPNNLVACHMDWKGLYWSKSHQLISVEISGRKEVLLEGIEVFEPLLRDGRILFSFQLLGERGRHEIWL